MTVREKGRMQGLWGGAAVTMGWGWGGGDGA